jgi:hypothetical protein
MTTLMVMTYMICGVPLSLSLSLSHTHTHIIGGIEQLGQDLHQLAVFIPLEFMLSNKVVC